MRFGFWSGWLTASCIALAALVPIVFRLRHGKRPAIDASPIALHVALGAGVALLAFTHALLSLFSLAETAIGNDLALAFGGGAVFVLVAHAGIGLQLRNPKLRDRPKKRRIHAVTATTIVVLVLAHAILLLRAG